MKERDLIVWDLVQNVSLLLLVSLFALGVLLLQPVTCRGVCRCDKQHVSKPLRTVLASIVSERNDWSVTAQDEIAQDVDCERAA